MFSSQKDFELDIQTAAMDMSALGGSGISIQVKGRNLDTLQEIVKEVAKVLKTVEGTEDVSDGLEDTTGEIRILVDSKKAMEYGLTVGQIFNQLYPGLAAPSSATTLSTPLKEYDVFVTKETDESMGMEELKNLEIESTDKEGKKNRILLSELADFTTREWHDFSYLSCS